MIDGLTRLTDDYDFKYFDCGDEDLNDFFLNESKIYFLLQSENLATQR
ncbi:hypothetical protein FHS68_003965 [Dyadobacter arcticus]|uniref:Uncharacterized protein n=1 Tax=Dyadobacter arcticus TaxID=1078754 RepID=A0ABX0UQU2_9BACT|nr:hypothetical protein [Dyadobacter arcticus]